MRVAIGMVALMAKQNTGSKMDPAEPPKTAKSAREAG